MQPCNTIKERAANYLALRCCIANITSDFQHDDTAANNDVDLRQPIVLLPTDNAQNENQNPFAVPVYSVFARRDAVGHIAYIQSSTAVMLDHNSSLCARHTYYRKQ